MTANQKPTDTSSPTGNGTEPQVPKITEGPTLPIQIDEAAHSPERDFIFRTGPSEKKNLKRQKPNFADFLGQLRQLATSQQQSKFLHSALSVLKTGFIGRPLPSEIELVFGVLKENSECSRLALRVYVSARSGRSSEVIRLLRGRMISHAQAVVKYPERSGDKISQDDRRDILLDWIDASTFGKTHTDQHESSNLDWARWTLLSLMEEHLLVRTDPIYAILDRFNAKSISHDGAQLDEAFCVELEKLVGAPKVNGQRITASLALASGARSCSRRLRQELFAADSTIRTQQTRCQELDTALKSSEEQYRVVMSRITELEESLQTMGNELVTEKRERGLDEEHWRSLTEQRLTKLASVVSTRLSHEISEAKLCLSGDSPNLQMAKDRLEQMEEALRNMRGA
jgi:hypothetical protein